MAGSEFSAEDVRALPRDPKTACDYVARIPMKHGVDSLNVASAAAGAFWELRKPAP